MDAQLLMRRPSWVLWVAFALALPACADLGRRAPDTCGNGVVETGVGEYCDSFADPALGGFGVSCVECNYVCTYAVGGPCPDGWSCGTDDICRYPSGTFVEVEDSRFEDSVEALHVGSVDRGDVRDLLGFGSGRLWARFGSSDAKLTSMSQFVMDSSTFWPPGFGDLDRDGREDAAFSSTAGDIVVVHAGEDGSLAAVSSPKRVVQADEGVLVVPVRTTATEPFEELLVLRATGTQLVAELVLSNDAVPPVALPLDRSLSDLVGLAVADLDPAAGNGVEVGLAFAGDDRVWVIRVVAGDSPSPPRIELRPSISLPWPVHRSTLDLGRARRGSLYFADEDGDGVRDALVSVASSSSYDLAVARGDGAGGFGAADLDPRLAYLGEAAAIGDLDGDGRADIVDKYVILINRGDFPETRAVVEMGARTAVIADFNRDGLEDVATAGGLREVSIFLGSPGGYFSPHRVQTRGIPFALSAGDFDGDGVDDLALAESLEAGDDVSVIFGNVGAGSLRSVPMASFASIDQLQGMVAVSRDLNTAADLLVQSCATKVDLGSVAAAGDPRSITVLRGSATRLMWAPVELAGRNQTSHVAVGRFSPDRGEDDPVDLAALVHGGMTLLVGDGDGQFAPGDQRFVPVDLPAQLSEYYEPMVADVDGDHVDELLFVNREQAFTAPELLVGHFTGTSQAPDFQLSRTPLTEFTFRRDARVADLDGDHRPDLLMLWGQAPLAFVVAYWNHDGTFDSAASTAVPVPWNASAIVPLQLDKDPELELAVVAEDAVYEADLQLDEPRRFIVVSVPLIGAGGTRTSVAGDVNGDGLDDLVLANPMGATVFKAVPGI